MFDTWPASAWELAPIPYAESFFAGSEVGPRYTNVLDVRWKHPTAVASWSSWPEFSDLVSTLEREIGDAGSRRAKSPVTTWIDSALGNFLLDYALLTGSDQQGWRRDELPEAAAKFVASATKWQRHLSVWTPLYGFDCPDYEGPILFEGGVELVAPVPGERRVLGWSRMGTTWNASTEFLLRTEHEVPLDDEAPSRTAFGVEGNWRAADAIRLTVGGNCFVYESTVIASLCECRPMPIGTVFQWYGGPTGRHPPTSTRLTKPDVPGVQECFRGLTALKDELAVPMRRYSSIARRASVTEIGRLEDQLIDAVIVIEALLVPDGREGEITLRLSLRAAWLLFPSDAGQRERTYEDARRVYKARSDVVHGMHVPALEEVAEKAAALASDALRVRLRFDGTRTEWKRHLNQVLIPRDRAADSSSASGAGENATEGS